MKIMLLAPPNWTPTMPHLALPTLTAYLRQHGVDVIQRDLNLEVFDTILTRDYMRGVSSRLNRRFGSSSNGHNGANGQNGGSTPPPERLQWARRVAPTLATQVERAKAVIRSERFFDGPAGLAAFTTLVDALEVASLPYYPAALHLQSYEAAVPVDSSRALLRGVRDADTNIFLDLFRDGIIADIEREQPDIVGISIPSMPQMLAAMTLAYLVKETGLPIHVTIGGPHVSMLREELVKASDIWALIDSAVIFDGEQAIYQLSQVLEIGADLSTVPNLIYQDGDQIRVNARNTPEKIANLPLPDFDGLPLERYLAPKLVLPLSHCPWLLLRQMRLLQCRLRRAGDL